MIVCCRLLSGLALLVSYACFATALGAGNALRLGSYTGLVELEGCLALLLAALFLVATFVLAALRRIATALEHPPL